MVFPVILSATAGALSGVAAFGGISIAITEAQFLQNEGAILNAYAQGIGKPVEELTSSDRDWAYDVFRHSYVSAKLSAAFGSSNAQIFDLWELTSLSPSQSNMDHWNNNMGRQIGGMASTSAGILDGIIDAMANGDFLLHPSDPREYTGDIMGIDGLSNLSPMSLIEALAEDISDFSEEIQNWFYNALDFLDSNSDGRSDGGQGGEGGGGGGDGGNGPKPPQKPNDEGNQGSPLVLDLDGDGVELYAAGAYGTYFDLRGNGQAVLTGWVEPDDGLLAIDLNADGVINDISELFGTQVTDGFTVLAALDSSGDGVINSSDARFGDLRVWTDTNSDGISQANELHTLAELNITEISLDATRLANVEIAGNAITHESSFTMGGQKQTIVDAWFAFNTTFTHNVEDYDFDIRAAFLPTLRGLGDLKDLHIAASTDSGTDPGTLMERLIALASNWTLANALADWGTVTAEVEDLLFRWAGIESVSPTGRGVYVDGQHLAFNEAVRGYDFLQYGQSNPLPEAGKYSEAVYQYLLTFYTVQLLTQIDGASVFTAPGYDLYTGGISGDLTLAQTGINAVETAAIAAGAGGADVWTHFAQFLGYAKGLDSLTISETAALDNAVANTGIPGLDDWQDVTNLMTVELGSIIDSSDDWGSFEIYYDNLVNGTSGDDTITDSNAGGFTDNEFRGLDGNDTISGLDGHDKLVGGAGNDTLEGGGGDDYLLGGMGDDIYRYQSGNDTVSEEGGSGYDELHIMASTGLTQSNLTDMYRYGDELILFLSTGSYITIHAYNGADTRIEKIIFDYNNSVVSG
ncbi:MAG: hypothetical protein JSS37_02540 [Proteobacteria bacterium]|nr:hypothetical protein [Pseudomonadota bacterium]